MRTIETTATISASGELSLRMPSDVAPGKHRIVVVIDPAPVAASKTKKSKLKIDSDFFASKSLEEILRKQKVKPYRPDSKSSSISDPALWEGFDEWLSAQRKEGDGTQKIKRKRGR